MTYNLWIDDERDPEDWLRMRKEYYMGEIYISPLFPEMYFYHKLGLKGCDFVWARNAHEAIEIIKERGVPEFLALDHDLGGDDVLTFLRWLQENHSESVSKFYCHSATSRGRDNVNSFMKSWRDSNDLDS